MPYFGKNCETCRRWFHVYRSPSGCIEQGEPSYCCGSCAAKARAKNELAKLRDR